MDVARPGLRERNREERHQRIRSAALDAFSDRGFDQVTVEEIAELARVSKSTLFRYFPTKEDLLVADDGHRVDDLRAFFLARPGDEPVTDSLKAAIVAFAAGYQDDAADQLRRFTVIRSTPALASRVLEQQSRLEEALAAVVASRLRPRADAQFRAKLLAATAMAVLRVAMKEWLLGTPHQDLAHLVSTGLDKLAKELSSA